MSRIFYPVRYRLDHKDRWLIWHSDDFEEEMEADGVVVEPSGSVPIFRTSQGLAAYAEAHNLLPLKADWSAFYNFDAVEKWLKRKRPAQLDCLTFLDTWNLLADLSATVGDDFDPDKAKTRKIYSKLFWGSNLPAVTPPGKRYRPVWLGSESRFVRHLFRGGLTMFRRRVKEAGKTED